MAEAKKSQYGVVEGRLYYVKIAESSPKYQSTDREYSVDVLVNKTTAKAWNKQFPKQKAKEFEANEFETKFKTEIPEEFQGEDELYIIKLKKAATKDGVAFDEKWRPKLLLDNKEGERVDVTLSRLCSNGVKAKVSYRVTENSFGVFAGLNNVLVQEDDFVEYVPSGGGVGSEFGESKPLKVEEEKKSATEARASKAAKKPPVVEEDDSSDSPF